MNDRTLPAPEDRETYPRRCRRCGGDVAERLVQLTLPDRHGRVRIIEGVPAGACEQCNENYLTVETSRAIDELLEGPPVREERAPVWEFPKVG